MDAVGRQPERGPAGLHKSSKGLDLPLAGEPAPQLDVAPAVGRVAALGLDIHGLKPTMLVAPGDRVALGQPLFEDKKNPGVRYVAPGAGRIVEMHRGERRALISVVIELDGASPERIPFQSYSGKPAESLSASELRALLLEAGLWEAFRTRPFSRAPAVDGQAAAIFITATDTRPHAPPPALVLADRLDDFRRGMAAVAKLTAGPTFLCQAPGATYDIPPEVRVAEFEGPHPSGNAGWHIHRLLPASLHRVVWSIGYQDVVAIGHLVATGELDVSRVISIGGPGAANPRLVRARLGASLEDLTVDGLGSSGTSIQVAIGDTGEVDPAGRRQQAEPY